jgi:hypothetical protein
MANSLTDGPLKRFFRVAKRLTILTGGVLRLPSQANPATCTKGELNVDASGDLNVCSATNTWTVVGTQS